MHRVMVWLLSKGWAESRRATGLGYRAMENVCPDFSWSLMEPKKASPPQCLGRGPPDSVSSSIHKARSPLEFHP